MERFDCLIIGAGPCGIGAALKLHDAGVNFGIIDGGTPGGKVNIAPRVDNYPGFKQILGPDLAFKLFERLMDKGISIIGDNILSLTKEGDLFKLEGQFDSYEAKAVLIATGTKEKKIGLPKEDEMLGHGLSYCSLCDGHFFKGQDVVVVGGGNAALKEAIHLSHILKKLYVVHRRNEFRGSNNLVDELRAMDNVEIITPSKELMQPLRADHTILMAMKKRLCDEVLYASCLNCRNQWRVRVADAPREFVCPRCNGLMVALLKEYDREAIKVCRKDKDDFTEEEAKIYSKLRRVANLVSTNGGRAAMVLAGRGVGPETASRILRNSYRDEDDFLREIMSAEVTFAKNKRFWD